MADLSAREGFVKVPGGKVWYRVVGSGEGAPLLVLHGGPGYPHDYLESLSTLAGGRKVVFYDQLGCGRSERPEDPSLWTIERAVLELAAVREQLGLTRIHLFGHSWGSMVAVDYALTWPDGLLSLILASPCISIPRWIEDSRTLRASLPEELQAVLRRGEEQGDYNSPDYMQAVDEYYRRFVCNVEPKPESVLRSDHGAGASVYVTLWGPNEFTLTGSLKDYDRTDRLQDLSLPVLYTCGRFDEATPDATAWYAGLTPNALLQVFEESAHLPQVSEPAGYNEALSAFIRNIEEHAEWSTTMEHELNRSSVGIFLCLLMLGFAMILICSVLFL